MTSDIRPGPPPDDEPIATPERVVPPDISTPAKTPFSWLGIVLGVALVALYFLISTFFPDGEPISVVLLSAAIVLVGGLLWIVLTQGFLDLMRAVRLQKRLVRGTPEEAENRIRVALDANEQRFGREDYRRTFVMLVVADHRRVQGRDVDALALYREALDVLRKVIEKRPYFYFIALNNLAVLQINHKKEADAEAALRQGAKLARPFAATQPMFEILMYFNLSRAQARQNKFDAAERSLDYLDDTLAEASAKTKKQWAHLLTAGRAWLASETQQWDEALRRSAELPKAHESFGIIPRARALLGLGRYQEAIEALRPHLEYLKQPGKALLDTVDTHLCLGECLVALHQPEQGLEHLALLRTLYEQVELISDPEWARILEKWIGFLEQHQQPDLARPLREELAQWTRAREASETGIRGS